MKVKLILPALTEAKGEYWRPIKYSLFPPLGLATLAGFLDQSDEVEIVDEHVESLRLDDAPDLVGIEIYITSAYRAYGIADHYRKQGSYVVLGGLHVTSLPYEALGHADTIVLGPAEEAWPRFLKDFRQGHPRKVYRSGERTLETLPTIRRDLIKRHRYLVPNSIVISRGCPHSCDFCYKESFFRKGKSYYHYTVDQALKEIESLPGKHLFFLDDNIFADSKFAKELFSQLRHHRRIWQGAATIQSLQDDNLIRIAAESGLRSLFVGFESLNQNSLVSHNKKHNQIVAYEETIRRLRHYGIMVNASFVFGFEEDDPSVFQTTVEWAIKNSIETATFHILTPYPATALYRRFQSEGRILSTDWNLYDTRHAVYTHPTMNRRQLEEGYWNAYSEFYRWGSIWNSSMQKENWSAALRHLTYTAAWKKCEPVWGLLIKLKQLNLTIPVLELVLKGYNSRKCVVSDPIVIKEK